MLDERTIDIIKSTVPVLKTHGENITGRFYNLMFQDHPELLNMFNQTNQKKQTQRAALANAVIAAAANIDQLEQIIPAVRQIGHKHTSIGVKPEHYPIVGKYLLLAIKDVLQDAATPEIMQAWEKAYGVIAEAFIGIEKDMYNEAGWQGYKEFTVIQKTKESKDITSFYIKPSDGSSLPGFEAGQYISIKVRIADSPYTHIRQYSLSDASRKGAYRISVKKDGAVSSHLHNEVQEGDKLEVSAPAGDFKLSSSEKPVVLISAGSGITPMMSMLKTAAEKQPERSVTFIHAAKNGEYAAFGKEAEQAAENHPNINVIYVYSEPAEQDRSGDKPFYSGRIDQTFLEQLHLNQDAECYLCGSAQFMTQMKDMILALGFDSDSVQYELFGPQLSMA
ncbi:MULTISPECIES: NO-inducible flavohemoprotein [Bacillus]|uniref:NO-inducible flavohemoprotein n=1 Tax=Bacillus TaxID=1386 RepID=UPI0003D5E867|nr:MULTISPECIES: NO-inducible flavohemoprotein [Bacillus]AHC43387.1 dihydropteridine reductase [Bacillus amyloliquefaciens LFB112]MBE1280687.1 NO-inducible flavohemoprotein [Bacillus sp. Bvel1]MBW8602845.1 NO-inducible flavohemoprotein [Bacillus amyloliquefaciens]MEE3674144.1 NO-inducible flavohemoprotein [Bacillus velezensis]OQV39346.1 nitric oxide dioxygenase [Bacillus velezensis]